MQDRPAHSPVGGSGVARFLKCAGSVSLVTPSIQAADPESEFAALGTAAHTLLEVCLRTKVDAWILVKHRIYNGSHIYGPEVSLADGLRMSVATNDEVIEVDADMANAVQVAIDAIREAHPDANQGNSWIERKFYCPSIHELYYGTADFSFYDEPNQTLHVWDYKHGAGIVVEAERNGQTMYYAAGTLEDLGLWDAVDTVVLHIAQPRGWHYDGPVREWSISTDELVFWLQDELVPGMDYALTHGDTVAGDHCRFCPVRLRDCPALAEKTERLEELLAMAEKKGGVEKLTDPRLGELIALESISKIRFKAARDVAFGRMQAGKKVPGTKLVKARSNRVYKKGADTAAREKFGDKAFSEPALLSPSKIEDLPMGEAFAAEWAFKPDTGLALVPDDDRRREVSRDTKAGFSAGKKRTVKTK